MVAGGTGLAPLRAVLEQIDRGWEATGYGPRVHLFHGSRMAWHLYDDHYLTAGQQAVVCLHAGGFGGSDLPRHPGACRHRGCQRRRLVGPDSHGLRLAEDGPTGGAGAQGCRSFCCRDPPRAVRLFQGTELTTRWRSR